MTTVKTMKNRLTTGRIIAAVFSTTAAEAANIRNADAEARSVTITENGVRNEQVVGPSATIAACAKGCFIVFPNGEMLPLAGPEDVVIENGAGRVVSK